jgi:wyosine [tRNA(Phe)-imidazoG37] synthetase (radical SAM superfamily)
VYCECGPTTELTAEIREYTPTDDILMELDRALSGIHELDYITFSGSGEPTLHSELGEIIEYLKINHPLFSIAVLTNATLLWKKEVRDSLRLADLVIPSLDAISSGTFNKMLRPQKDITPEKVVEGLTEFSREFNGLIYLEVFIIPGINDSDDELARIKMACENITHDEIHLNTLDRPAAEEGIEPAGPEVLERALKALKPLNVRIVGRPVEREFASSATEAITESILAILRRRPSTIDDLSMALGIAREELKVILEKMLAQKIISREKQERGDFYMML